MSDGWTAARDRIAENLRRFPTEQVTHEGRRAAAVAVVLVVSGNDLGVWITRRTPSLRAHAGQFALPGGRIDPGEDAVSAALRELREELGIELERGAVLGGLDDYATRSGYVITPVVAWAGQAPPLLPNPDEVAEVHFVGLDELDVAPRFARISESSRPVIQVPLLDTLIHAPTGAVLHQFREVALHGRHTRVRDLEQPPFAWR